MLLGAGPSSGSSVWAYCFIKTRQHPAQQLSQLVCISLNVFQVLIGGKQLVTLDQWQLGQFLECDTDGAHALWGAAWRWCNNRLAVQSPSSCTNASIQQSSPTGMHFRWSTAWQLQKAKRHAHLVSCALVYNVLLGVVWQLGLFPLSMGKWLIKSYKL